MRGRCHARHRAIRHSYRNCDLLRLGLGVPQSVTIHKRLKALARDPDVPRWCKFAILLGLTIAGPVDELVIYPVVAGFLWSRRRHVLARHGFGGLHVLAALVTMLVFASALGLVGRVALGLL